MVHSLLPHMHAMGVRITIKHCPPGMRTAPIPECCGYGGSASGGIRRQKNVLLISCMSNAQMPLPSPAMCPKSQALHFSIFQCLHSLIPLRPCSRRARHISNLLTGSTAIGWRADDAGRDRRPTYQMRRRGEVCSLRVVLCTWPWCFGVLPRCAAAVVLRGGASLLCGSYGAACLQHLDIQMLKGGSAVGRNRTAEDILFEAAVQHVGPLYGRAAEQSNY